MSHEALREVVHQLRSEPLFGMSMASRELFHSNFIAWLIETHPDAGYALVGEAFGHPGDPQQLLVVEREKRHVDLHIHSFSGHDIWVEMKIGAIPTRAQLDRYSAALADASGRQRFVLVSLRPLVGLPEPWTSTGLSELARAFDAAASWVTDDFERELVSHEATLLRLVDSVGIASDPTMMPRTTWFYDKATRASIRAARANTLVEKARMGALLNHLRTSHSGHDLDSAAGFTNGSGLVEFRKLSADGSSVGWQLQGNQYRLFAQSSPGSPLTTAPGDLASTSVWFDFEPARATLPGLTLGTRASGMGKFDDSFAYQYLQLPAGTTNAEVMSLLHPETRRLADLKT